MSQRQKDAIKVFAAPLGIFCIILFVCLVSNVSVTYWLSALIWTMGWGIFFAVMRARHWLPATPDEVRFPLGLFCEDLDRSNGIIQPVNTWTNLGFVAAGLIVLLHAGTQATPPLNTLGTPDPLAVLVYGLLAIFLGPGSMLFHASGKQWAGFLDMISMVAWVGFCLSYTASRLLFHWFDVPLASLWVMWLAIVVITGAISGVKGYRAFLASAYPDSSAPTEDSSAPTEDHGIRAIMYIIAAWIVVEIVVVVMMLMGNPPGFTRNPSWLFGALTAYIAAFVYWLPSNGVEAFEGIKRQWCHQTDHWYQAHGFWHLFCAVGTLFIYLYFATEMPI
jgi:hypothetical protein